MKIAEINAKLNNSGLLVIDSDRKLSLKELINEEQSSILSNTNVRLTISLDENEFLSGINGIVWATYDLRQAEVIKSALLVQSVFCELKKFSALLKNLFLVKVEESETIAASEFIWKSESGLRLKPDWYYNEGDSNHSFEQWLNGR